MLDPIFMGNHEKLIKIGENVGIGLLNGWNYIHWYPGLKVKYTKAYSGH